jgi:TolB-like protein/Tfp pilus assembly protein PilF
VYLRKADGFERWAEVERASTARSFARAAEALAERASAMGDARGAVTWWRRLVHTEPLSARATVGFMHALDAVGERAEALRHAQLYERLVREEVGAPVDSDIATLATRLQHAPPMDFVVSGANRKLAVSDQAPRNAPADGSPPAPSTSVAVLPFVNTSGDPNDEPFSDGLTDELISRLGRAAGLTVTGRTSAFALKGRGLAVRAIADTLGVATVLEGSVRRTGDRLKVTAQLVRASDNAILWAEMYGGELADVFAVQEEVARAIVTALRAELGSIEAPYLAEQDGASAARLPERAPTSVEAHESYLRGRHLLNTRLTEAGLRQALRYFEHAVTCDPAYARAHAGISDVHAHLAIFGHGRASAEFAAARAAALRALALDDTLAEAHVAMAHILFVHDFEWAEAERSFRRALALDASHPSAHFLLAVCLQDQGRFDEAITEMHTARALDPLSSHVGNLLGRIHVNARRPDDAIRYLRDALELNPESDLAYQQLGHAYLQRGMADDALAALRQAAARSGARDAAHLAYAYAVSGDAAAARRILEDLLDPATNPDVAPFHIAMAFAGLGERDTAFHWLERAYAERAAFMDGVRITPAFDSLHADPRWSNLLRRMGLAA